MPVNGLGPYDDQRYLSRASCAAKSRRKRCMRIEHDRLAFHDIAPRRRCMCW
jgi:hypothetical protein